MNGGKSEDVLRKSRYGRTMTKKIFNDESSSSDLIRSVNGVRKRNRSKNLSTSVSNCILNCKLRKRATNVFSIGDMVWAKSGKYPLWPGIITSDPDTNNFSKKENNIPMLHICYCNDAYKRNWLSLKQISQFLGKNDSLVKNPKLMAQISRSKLKVRWNKAVREAECLLALKKDERINAFFDTTFIYSDYDVKLENNIQTESTSTHPNPTSTPINTNELTKLKSNIKLEECSDDEVPDQKTPAITPNLQKDHPRILIPELCKLFYTNGWVTGTGGGISIKYNGKIFIAPSGVQKERMEPDDVFVQDMNGVDIEVPTNEKNLSKSQCTPIFMCAYIERNAGAVIHIHSPELVKLCLLNPENELRIRDLEMIKGIYNEEKGRFYDNDEEVIIPIIENSKYERDLVDTFQLALMKYPSTSAVVVRNHGIYVWGNDWKSAKTQCECYEYVFNIMVFKKINNL